MPLSLSAQEVNYPFSSKCSFKTLENRKKKDVAISHTTSSHCTPMADSVQWLNQSDYSIYISVPLEFYQSRVSYWCFIMIIIPDQAFGSVLPDRQALLLDPELSVPVL